jgi:predicted metal-dependent peptidase
MYHLRRNDMALTIEDRITKAHVALMQHPKTMAFSGILMVGKTSVSHTMPTAGTNGRDVIYGHDFVDGLTDAELRGLVLHENKHKMYQHLFIWRKLYEEDAQLANLACDYVINLEIKDLDRSGQFITLPKDGCIDEKYRGLDSGEVFKLLQQDKKNGKGNGGKPLDDHQWEDAKTMSEADKQALVKEIDSAIRTGALMAGKQGGDIDRSFDALMQSKIDWKEQLREFVSTICVGKGDSTWAKPNRRWLQQDMYLPSQVSESISGIGVGIDTSGSISGEDIAKALTELVTICNTCTPERVDLMYWDTRVAAHEVYFEGDYAGLVTSTKPAGGGGSSSLCAFEYVKEKSLKPACVVMITDGYIEYPQGAPSYPVLWVIVGGNKTPPPFGVTLRVD